MHSSTLVCLPTSESKADWRGRRVYFCNDDGHLLARALLHLLYSVTKTLIVQVTATEPHRACRPVQTTVTEPRRACRPPSLSHAGHADPCRPKSRCHTGHAAPWPLVSQPPYTVMTGHGRSWRVMENHGRSWQGMSGHGLHWCVSHNPCHHVYRSRRPHTTYTPAQCIYIVYRSLPHKDTQKAACRSDPCNQPGQPWRLDTGWSRILLAARRCDLYLDFLCFLYTFVSCKQAARPTHISSLSGSCLMRSWRRVLSSRYLFSAAPPDLLLQLRQECRGGQPASEDVSK